MNGSPPDSARKARSAKRSVACTSPPIGSYLSQMTPPIWGRRGPAARATILKPTSYSGMVALRVSRLRTPRRQRLTPKQQNDQGNVDIQQVALHIAVLEQAEPGKQPGPETEQRQHCL